MSGVQITPPFTVFTDDDGDPLENGLLFIGQTNLNPETNPVSVFYDSALTIPASQPIRTSGGYPVRSGTPSSIYTSEITYSITVKNKKGELVFSSLNSSNTTETDAKLADADNPNNGAAIIGRGAQFINSIAELRSLLKTVPSKTAFALGYYAAGDGGGGAYSLDPLDTTSADNGGTIIVATDGGRWKLVYKDHVSLRQFGAKGDFTTDGSAAWQAALTYCASNHVALYVPDGRYRVDTKAVIDGVSTGFAFVRIFGDGRATGPALDSAPLRCGPVIVTNGAGALEVWFRQFSNEAITIDGVSFYDQTTPSLATVPAVKIKQGDPGGTQRYITNLNFENIAAVGYEHPFFFQGMYPNTTHTDLDNYIGPTSFKRYFPYKCGSGITLSNCTMNRFRLTESLFFDLSLGGIIVDKAFSISEIPFAQATGGTLAGALDMVHMEGVRGCFRLREIGASFSAHVLNLNDVTRELCGVDGSGTGDPYGFVKPVILTVNGRTEKGLAFGENSLVSLPAGSEVSSENFANFTTVTAAGGLKIHTPRTINAHELSGSIPSSSNDVVTVNLANPSEFYSMDFEVEYLAGIGGRRIIHVSGDSAFGGTFSIDGAANPDVGETVVFPLPGQIQITLNTTSASNVPYRIKTANFTGMQFTIAT